MDTAVDMSEALAVLERGCVGKRRLGRRRAVALAHARGLAPYRCLLDPTHWHVGHCPSLAQLERLALAIRVRAGNGPATLSPHAFDQATGTRDRLTSGTRAGSYQGPVV